MCNLLSGMTGTFLGKVVPELLQIQTKFWKFDQFYKDLVWFFNPKFESKSSMKLLQWYNQKRQKDCRPRLEFHFLPINKIYFVNHDITLSSWCTCTCIRMAANRTLKIMILHHPADAGGSRWLPTELCKLWHTLHHKTMNRSNFTDDWSLNNMGLIPQKEKDLYSEYSRLVCKKLIKGNQFVPFA
jgi:hypothetical protein